MRFWPMTGWFRERDERRALLGGPNTSRPNRAGLWKGPNVGDHALVSPGTSRRVRQKFASAMRGLSMPMLAREIRISTVQPVFPR